MEDQELGCRDATTQTAVYWPRNPRASPLYQCGRWRSDELEIGQATGLSEQESLGSRSRHHGQGSPTRLAGRQAGVGSAAKCQLPNDYAEYEGRGLNKSLNGQTLAVT